MYLFPLLEVVGKRPHIYEYIFPYLVVLGSTVVKYTTFIFILSSRYVSGSFSLVDFNLCLLMCRCTIVVFLDLSRCFLISFSMITGQVFRKTCLIVLIRLAVVGPKSAACKYLASSGFEVFPECCSPHFLIVVAPGDLPTFLYSCL